MASLRVHPDRLEIHLTTAEKTLALRREDLVIPRGNIKSVTITDDPWIWVRGIRAPGALVPLVLAIGVWKFHGGKDFLAIKRKRQAVVLHLRGDDFARVILSTNHAPDLIASLKLDDGETVELAAAAAPAASAEPASVDPVTAEPAAPVKKRPRARKVAAPAEPTDDLSVVKPVEPVKPVTAVPPAKAAPAVKAAVKPARPTKTAQTKDAPAAPQPAASKPGPARHAAPKPPATEPDAPDTTV